MPQAKTVAGAFKRSNSAKSCDGTLTQGKRTDTRNPGGRVSWLNEDAAFCDEIQVLHDLTQHAVGTCIQVVSQSVNCDPINLVLFLVT